MNSISKTVGLAIMAVGLAAALPVFAQSETEQTPQAETPAMKPGDMEGMMGGGDMSGMMNMMTQMNEMMGACTKMMQAMIPDAVTPDESEALKNPG